MTGKLFFPLVGLLAAVTLAAQPASGGYPIDPVPFTSVKVTPDSFWGQRLKASRELGAAPESLPRGHDSARFLQVRERGPVRELREGGKADAFAGEPRV